MHLDEISQQSLIIPRVHLVSLEIQHGIYYQCRRHVIKGAQFLRSEGMVPGWDFSERQQRSICEVLVLGVSLHIRGFHLEN